MISLLRVWQLWKNNTCEAIQERSWKALTATYQVLLWKNERYQGHLWNDRFATLGSCTCKAQPPVATGFWAAKSLQRGGSDPRASNSADNSAPESMMCRDRLSNCWQVDLPIAEVTLWYPVLFRIFRGFVIQSCNDNKSDQIEQHPKNPTAKLYDIRLCILIRCFNHP